MGSAAAYETNAGKRYRVIYRKPDHIQTQKRGFRTKRDAELFLAKVEIDKSRGAYVDPAKSRVLLGEWLDVWMASRSDWRETSRERVRGIVVRHIKPELGGYPLASLNHQPTGDRPAWTDPARATPHGRQPRDQRWPERQSGPADAWARIRGRHAR
jgi:hypothetical protein